MAAPSHAWRLPRPKLPRPWGVSVDFLEDHVLCELRIVRRGRRRLIPVVELTRWLETSADRALPDERPYSPRERERNASSRPAASRSLPGIKWP